MRQSSFLKNVGLLAVTIVTTGMFLRSRSKEQVIVSLPDGSKLTNNVTVEMCPPRPLLTMVHGGRLGNLIGTYATLYAFARLYNYHAIVPPDVLDKLKNDFPKLSLPSSTTVPSKCRKVYRTEFPSNISQPGVNIQLPMYLAHLITFHPYRQEIIKEFEFHPTLRQKAEQYLQTVKRRHRADIVVGVHVRRTDYVKYIQNRWGDTVVDENYIHKAMECVIEDNRNLNMGKRQHKSLIFVVLSDDIKWCKERLNRTRFGITFRDKPETPGLDMAILAHCDRVIVSVGSYGFWGAYLGQKSVIYPNKKAPFYEHVDQIHIKGWIKLPT